MTTSASGLPAYRAFQQNKGEALFLPLDMVTMMSRFSEFAQVSGVDPSRVRTSALISTPTFEPGATIRDLNPDPDFAWHPLLWLPKRFAQREGEDLDHWMIRVSLEMSESSLYNMVDGNWFDVLAHLGIAVDYPQGRERVRRWLDGEADETLDNFDLDQVLAVPDDVDWAYDSATEMTDDLKVVSYARAADSIRALVTEVTETDDEMFTSDPARRVSVCTTAAVAAVSYLGDIQDIYDVDFAALRDQIHQMTPEQLHDPDTALTQLLDVCGRIFEDTHEREDQLLALFTDQHGENPSEQDLMEPVEVEQDDDGDQ